MDKQREEFEKSGYDMCSTKGGNWDVWQAAQAAMQPEIDYLKSYIEGQDDSFATMMKQLSAANQRIEELEQRLNSFSDIQKRELLLMEKIANLEERIRVADAEEPVGYVQKGIYVNSAGRLAISDEQLPVYLHAQIPAEVERKQDELSVFHRGG